MNWDVCDTNLLSKISSLTVVKGQLDCPDSQTNTQLLRWLNCLLPLALAREKCGLQRGELEKLQAHQPSQRSIPSIHSLNNAFDGPVF